MAYPQTSEWGHYDLETRAALLAMFEGRPLVNKTPFTKG